jgi:putative transposase
MYQITIQPRSKADHWRALAEYWKLSPIAKQRLEWIIFYHTVANDDASKTAKYFGISRKTFNKWKNRFNPNVIQSLEEVSRRPHQVRQWQVTPTEEKQIIEIRKDNLVYGKVKLKILYQNKYQEEISTWKIERVIRKHKLYPQPGEYQKQLNRKKRRDKRSKLRINTINTKLIDPGKLWHTDCIILNWYGTKRTIVTAIEDKTKLGFARTYLNHSSRSAADFLKRLTYLSDGEIKIIHHDNGSEFEGEFNRACKQLNLGQLYSRVRTPTDNPALERFNRTVQDEWLALSEIGLDDIGEANIDLTNWLIKYNVIRPHQALDYLTPLEYASINYFRVLPMWSASTIV